jgi:hypothetical protein
MIKPFRSLPPQRFVTMRALACLLLACIALLGTADQSEAFFRIGSLCPPGMPKNTAFYLKNCCPKPCPVFDKQLYKVHMQKVSLLQKWAQVEGLQNLSTQLMLMGVGQRIAALPLVDSPIASYRALEQAEIASCFPSPDELVENNLLTPYTNPPESLYAFRKRAAQFALSLNTENAPLFLSSAPERVSRRFCRQSLKDNYAGVQIAVSMSMQATLGAFQQRLYENIRLAAASSTTSCAPKNGNLQSYITAIQQQLGGALGTGSAAQIPALPGCLRQDVMLNSQVKADQALLQAYLTQMRILYNFGNVFNNLPGKTEFGVY